MVFVYVKDCDFPFFSFIYKERYIQLLFEKIGMTRENAINTEKERKE